MQTRLCDLGLSIQGTVIQEYIDQFYEELRQKGMQFLPPCYLSDEWFSPNKIGVIAIPFYLAHPKLHSLEKRMMKEVEGGTKPEALKLLRHECGHAYVHAFNLTSKRHWRETFGHPGKAYTEHYKYRPYSKSFVSNLENFYAQSHPEEDFAETFAVWLDPQSGWKELYKNWPVFPKLKYVDELMSSLKDRTVKISKREYYYPIISIKKRLSLHYDRMKKLYIEEEEDFFDADLKKFFSPAGTKGPLAAQLMMKHRKYIENSICRYTREKKYIISSLVSKLIKRLKVLELRAERDSNDYMIDFAVYVTSLSSNYRYTNRYKGE